MTDTDPVEYSFMFRSRREWPKKDWRFDLVEFSILFLLTYLPCRKITKFDQFFLTTDLEPCVFRMKQKLLNLAFLPNNVFFIECTFFFFYVFFTLQSIVKIHFWFCAGKSFFSGTRSFRMFSIITAYKLFVQCFFSLYKSYVSHVYTHTICSIRVKLISSASLLAVVISPHIYGALLLKSISSVPLSHLPH